MGRTNVARAAVCAVLLGVLTALAGCDGDSRMKAKHMTTTVEADLNAIAGATIYFGHQSVGANIIDGLKDLQGGASAPVNIAELGTVTLPREGGVLVHTAIGRNEEPVSKCQDFRRVLDDELKGRVDVALLKFCYIDFNEETDVEGLFTVYRETLEALKREHPETLFVHLTVPLRHTASGPGVWIRELLGRPNRSKLANMRRNEFNRLLEQTFADEPIFDLAASQSTYPDGRREFFQQDGQSHYSLIAGYTDDGGHLNAVGRRHVAADFVHAVADALRVRNAEALAAG